MIRRVLQDRYVLDRPKPSPERMETLKYLKALIDSDQRHKFNTFEDLDLKPEVLKGVLAEGYEAPAQIQKKAIDPGIKGHDLIIQAQSGMGKTAAMLMIVLERLDIENPKCQTLILTPTRELTIQIHQILLRMGRFLGKIKVMACYGGSGVSWRDERSRIRGGCHIVVGTLGRLTDLMSKNAGRGRPEIVIDGSKIGIFVIDEADKMLTDFSCKDDIQKMFKKISGDAQIILMSATMPMTALMMAHQVTHNPIPFYVNKSDLTLEGISQFHVKTGEASQERIDALSGLLKQFEGKFIFVFCNTRPEVSRLCSEMEFRRIPVKPMEGLIDQKLREKTLNQFRRGEVKALITSDLLGRGIDVQQLSIVINFDFPINPSNYIHRVGRSGRYGRTGIAITLVNENHLEHLAHLEKFYKTQIPQLPADLTALALS